MRHILWGFCCGRQTPRTESASGCASQQRDRFVDVPAGAERRGGAELDDHVRTISLLGLEPLERMPDDWVVKGLVLGQLGRPKKGHLGAETTSDVGDLGVVRRDDQSSDRARSAGRLDGVSDQRPVEDGIDILPGHRLRAGAGEDEAEDLLVRHA